jgi:hypothetical protein
MLKLKWQGGSFYQGMRVFPVGFPFCGIEQNIFPDPGKFIFTSDNVFIIAALPDWYAR